MNIFQKMSKATEKIGVVAKNLTIASKKQSYKAVSERDIIDAVKPIEAECGIYSYPVHREIVEQQMLEKSNDYGTTTSIFLRLKTVYRFVNVDDPKEYIDITTYGDGVDTQDKATGKAMTYADKYALMKAYKISTGDDPDQEASQEWSKAKPMKTTDEGYNNLCVEWSTLRSRLSELGCDLHGQQFSKYVEAKTGLKTQDITMLNAKQLSVLVELYKKAISQKESKNGKNS